MVHPKPLASASVVPLQSRKERSDSGQKRPRQPARHHPGIIGDIFIEREPLEIRITGEIISETRGRHRAESALGVTLRTDKFKSLTSLTIRCQPRGRTFLLRIGTLRLLSKQSPAELASGPARLTSAVMATLQKRLRRFHMVDDVKDDANIVFGKDINFFRSEGFRFIHNGPCVNSD